MSAPRAALGVLQQRPTDALHPRPSGTPRTEGLHPTVAASDAGAGINRYWDYEERPVPGIGKAMLNVGTGNLVVQSTDFDVPERGLDLVMQRTYNSQSLHDANGDDGSEQAIFGNGWTNTYDAHLIYRSNGDISVYDIDGTRCDYSPETDGSWKPCAGEHATLEVDPNIPCSYWWIKKTGTAYWFDTPIPGGCFIPQGNIGRLYEIVGRNSGNAITLQYSFVQGQPQTAENITEIDVNHSNGQSVKMTFGQVGGSGPNELNQISLPDGGEVSYKYDAQGDLAEVDRTDGNDAASVLPETYTGQPMQFACGPRATISNQTDGACMKFDYDSNVNLVDWKVNGILNFDPNDGFGRLQPAPIPTSWRTWYTANFVYGADANSPCGATNANTTTMCDVDGHSTIWQVNGTAQVTRAQLFTGPSSSLVTAQAWDPNSYDLLSTTDPRGNETDYGYDKNGNTVEVLEPLVKTSQGQTRPMSLYSYDTSNNIIAYCDPVSNVGKTPPTQMTDSLCPTNSGSGNYVYQYTYPQYEPFGELTYIATPCYQSSCQDGGNYTTITYDPGSQGGTDYGLPTSVIGRGYSQKDGTSRNPKQDFTYDTVGNLVTDVTGENPTQGGAGKWTITYTPDHMNRVQTRTDPDADTSQTCYQPDGSVYYTETPYQYDLDNGAACSTASPAPNHSVSFSHDADGNVTKETHHHGGQYEASFPHPTATPDLDGTAGTTKKYYDGEDRLVEVEAPQDGTRDIFANPWITRYLYDLTQGSGSATLSFQGKSGDFAGYGNLYDTQELVPAENNGTLTWGAAQISAGGTPAPSPTPLVNSTFSDLNATAFDGADRPIAKYRVVYTNSAESLSTELLTYDNTPDSIGLLTSDCQHAVQECKIYTYDAMAHVIVDKFNINGAPAPNTAERDLTYDPDGRVEEIAQQPTSQLPSVDDETFTYDFDGRLLKIQQPGHGTLLDYYYDGKRHSMGANGNMNANTFYYSYAPDGTLQQLNFAFPSGHSGYQVYTLSAAGRVNERDDFVGSTGPMSTMLMYKDGLVTEEDFPCGNCGVAGLPQGSHAAMAYSAEGELLGRLVTAPWSFTVPGQHHVSQYAQTWYYNSRGEVVSTFDHTGSRTDTRYANGVQVVTFPMPTSPATFGGAQATWSPRMGAAISSKYSSSTQSQGKATLSGQSSSISYDADGRNTGSGYQAFCSISIYPYICSGTQISEGTSRSYDVENHVVGASATYMPPTGIAQPLASDYVWGANGHPWKIGSTPTNGQQNDDSVFWDGDSAFYSLNSSGQIDDIKIGSMGEWTPKDTGYTDITFYDRGVDGTVAFCHNASGGSGGLGDGDASMTHTRWQSGGPVQPCGPATAFPTWGMQYPLNVAWNAAYGGALTSGSVTNGGIGNGWTIGMPRTDGIVDGVSTIQGVRAYDPIAGQWTAPDAYLGNVADPMTQKAYMWNENNPVLYGDPSGYCTDPAPGQARNGCLGGVDWNLNMRFGNALKEVLSWFAIPGGEVAGTAKIAVLLGKVGDETLERAIMSITDRKLGNIANNLFRPQDKVLGGSAGALRKEVAESVLVGGKSHYTKVIESIVALKNWIKSNASSAAKHNLDAAQAMLKDLEDALKAAQQARSEEAGEFANEGQEYFK